MHCDRFEGRVDDRGTVQYTPRVQGAVEEGIYAQESFYQRNGEGKEGRHERKNSD